MLSATWTNAPEHAAGPLEYWGSRGRRFKSCRPDRGKVFAGHTPAEALFVRPEQSRDVRTPVSEPFTRHFRMQLAIRSPAETHLRACSPIPLLRVSHIERREATRDCQQVSTRLERALLSAGQTVVRVPPKLMAGARRSAWTWGKSDPTTPWPSRRGLVKFVRDLVGVRRRTHPFRTGPTRASHGRSGCS
jgi:hypothetical protein